MRRIRKERSFFYIKKQRNMPHFYCFINLVSIEQDISTKSVYKYFFKDIFVGLEEKYKFFQPI
jgi:hypothetical protein